jgi:hypothetical protein
MVYFHVMIFGVKWLARVVICGAFCCGIVAPISARQAPHAAHGPRFGGAFTTASNDTVHVEVVWSEQRRVRMFFTDASGSPLPLEQMRGVQARIMTGDRATPFVWLEVDYYFEARIPTLTLPAVMTVEIKLSDAATEERRSFTFRQYSPAIPGMDGSSPVDIPITLNGILAALAEEHRGMQSAIARGAFPELLGTEDRVRDLVLAIEPHLDAVRPETRRKAQSVVTNVVRACWLLHTVLDYGTAAQRDAVVDELSDLLEKVAATLPGTPR